MNGLEVPVADAERAEELAAERARRLSPVQIHVLTKAVSAGVAHVAQQAWEAGAVDVSSVVGRRTQQAGRWGSRRQTPARQISVSHAV